MVPVTLHLISLAVVWAFGESAASDDTRVIAEPVRQDRDDREWRWQRRSGGTMSGWSIRNPTQGSEITKTRPCVVVSPDEMNRHIRTVIVAPMTSRRRRYPTRVDLTFQRIKGQVVLDQIRTIDKSRLARKLGRLPEPRARDVAGVLVEMFSYG
jgi:mRNA interferase MazF